MSPHAARAEEILATLVAIPSESSLPNGPIADFAESVLAPRGWTVRRAGWRDARGVEKVNLVASSHAGPQAALAFAGHADTVPAAPGWADAVTLRDGGDGRLTGLGACDMKGFLAASLAVCESLDPRRLTHPLQFILTADEEVGCLGAKRLAREDRGLVLPHRVVVGEPTALAPACAGKGYGLLEVVVHGREAHSAFPARGHSAIFDAARVLRRLEELAGTLAVEETPGYEPPHATLNVGLIRGGSAKNVVAGRCEMTVEFRPPGGLGDGDRLRERILETLAELHPAVELTVTPVRTDPGFATPRDSPLVRLASEKGGRATASVSYGTEAPYFAELGAEVIVCGPGDMTRAHRAGEYLTRAELAEATAFLAALAAAECGGQ